MASGGGQGAIKAGQAFVGLALDDSDFVKGLERAKKQLKTTAGYLVRTGAAIGAAGGAILAPITKIFTDVVERGSTLKGLADRLGMTVEKTSVLATGFEAAGVSLDEFGGIMDGVNNKIMEAASSNTELITGLRGLNGKVLAALPPEERITAIFEAFKGITLTADQANEAQKLGMDKLLPSLKKGKDGYDAINEAGAKGFMNVGQAEQSKALMKAYTETWMSLKYTIMEVGAALLPTADQINSVMGYVREGTGFIKKFITQNKTLVAILAGVGVALVAAGIALVAFAAVASVVGTAISAIIAIVSAFGVVANVVFAPITLTVLAVVAAVGLLAVALAGVGYLFATQTEAGGEMFAQLSAQAKGFTDTFKEAWGGIGDAISDGNLLLAANIAFSGLNVIWKKALLKMTEGWVGFKGSFVDGFRDIVAGVKLMFLDFGAWLSRSMGAILRPVFKKIAQGLRAVNADEWAAKFEAASNVTDEDINRQRDADKADVLKDRAAKHSCDKFQRRV